MKPSHWRAGALTLIAVAIAFVCYQATIPDRDTFGLHFTVPRQSPGNIRVTSVDANSPAALAGIGKGDLIWYGSTAFERARAQYPTPGSHVTLTVNGSRAVTLTARQRPPLISFIVLPFIIRFAFLSVAALLAWRRPEDTAARSLVVFLFCYGLAISLNSGVLATPVLSLLVMSLLNTILLLAGTSAAATFAAKFPSGQAKPAPQLLANTSQILAATGTVVTTAGIFFANSAAAVSTLGAVIITLFAIVAGLVIATLIVAYVQGENAERQRRRWVFMLLGIALGAAVVDLISWNTIGSRLIDDLALLAIGALPFGLAYVILRHRVIDVGFVLNRAVVYGGVSVIVVGIFVIVETLMAKYVEAHSHIGSIAVQLVVALVLGFSVRAIHTRVDRFVDRVFFRERHEAESAMRDFAFDAPYITEGDVLLRRCVEVVREYAHASNAGVWLRNETGYEQAEGTFVHKSVGENDPAIVAMRARRVVAELPSLRSSLPGVLAFPMIVRGKLIGTLLCGPKTEDETYAPDEREALSSIATSVAHAIDGLRVTELEQTVERLLAGQPAGATQGAMGTF